MNIKTNTSNESLATGREINSPNMESELCRRGRPRSSKSCFSNQFLRKGGVEYVEMKVGALL
jgi:hypothetical protein